MKFRDWHTVTTGSACWKRMLLSICCAWANTHILFPIHLGLAICIFFTSALSRSLPCCYANKVCRKHHLALLCTISSPGLGTLKTSLASQAKWTITAVPLLLCRSTSLKKFDDTISKLLCHHSIFTCLTSAQVDRKIYSWGKIPKQTLNHRLKSQELYNFTKCLLLR